jgi:hypothetical protein
LTDLLSLTDLGFTYLVTTAGAIAVYLNAYANAHATVKGNLNVNYIVKGKSVEWSHATGLLGQEVPITGSAAGSNLAIEYDKPVNVLANCTNTSSISADLVVMFSFCGESDGSSTVVGDVPAMMDLTAISSDGATTSAYLSSTMHASGKSRSYSFANATPVFKPDHLPDREPVPRRRGSAANAADH